MNRGMFFWLGAFGLLIQNLFFLRADGGDGGGAGGDGGGNGGGNAPSDPNPPTPPSGSQGDDDLRAQLEQMRKENEEFRKRFEAMDQNKALEEQLSVAQQKLENYEKHFPDFNWRNTIEAMKKETDEAVKEKYKGAEGVFNYYCDFLMGKANIMPPNGNITKGEDIKAIEEKLSKGERLSADEEVAYMIYKEKGGI